MNGSRMKDMEWIIDTAWQTGRIKVSWGQSSTEAAKEDRNEENACGIEKKIAKEENEIEKNENESEDGVVEHSKAQALKSRKICQKFWA